MLPLLSNMTSRERVKKILENEVLVTLKKYLEQSHSMDVLLLNYTGLGKWKEAKEFLQGLSITISDGTFRTREKQLVELGMAKAEPLDPLKYRYEATEMGRKIAELLLKFYEESGAYLSE